MALNDKANLAVLADLAEAIAARRGASADKSYTAKLFAKGIEKCAQKTGEEAVEFVIAVAADQREEIPKEAADLLYHLLVTLECTGVSLDDVLLELGKRRGISGHEEKASRVKT